MKRFKKDHCLMSAAVFCLLCVPALNAQFAPNKRAVSQFGQNNSLDYSQSYYANMLQIIQYSSNQVNEAVIVQASPSNIAAVEQYHSPERGAQCLYLAQNGNGEHISVQIQGISAESRHVGCNNALWLRQDGWQNTASQTQQRANADARLYQSGSRNEGEQQQSNEAVGTLNSEQIGSDNAFFQSQEGQAPIVIYSYSQIVTDGYDITEKSRAKTQQIGEGHDVSQRQNGVNRAGFYINMVGGVSATPLLIRPEFHVESWGHQQTAAQVGLNNRTEQTQSGLNDVVLDLSLSTKKLNSYISQMGHTAESEQHGSGHSALQFQDGMNGFSVLPLRSAGAVSSVLENIQLSVGQVGHQLGLTQSGSGNAAEQHQSGVEGFSLQYCLGISALKNLQFEIQSVGHTAEAGQAGSGNTLYQEQSGFNQLTYLAPLCYGGETAVIQLPRIGHEAQARQNGDGNVIRQLQDDTSEMTLLADVSLLEAALGCRAVAQQTGNEHFIIQSQNGYSHYVECRQAGAGHHAMQQQTGVANSSIVIQNLY